MDRQKLNQLRDLLGDYAYAYSYKMKNADKTAFGRIYSMLMQHTLFADIENPSEDDLKEAYEIKQK